MRLQEVHDERHVPGAAHGLEDLRDEHPRGRLHGLVVGLGAVPRTWAAKEDGGMLAKRLSRS